MTYKMLRLNRICPTFCAEKGGQMYIWKKFLFVSELFWDGFPRDFVDCDVGVGDGTRVVNSWKYGGVTCAGNRIGLEACT